MKSILTLIGAFLLTLISSVSGTLPILFPYTASYYRTFDPNSTNYLFALTLPVFCLSGPIGIFFASKFVNKVNFRIILGSGIIFTLLGHAVLTWISNALLSMLLCGFLLGIGANIINICSMPICWKHFPNRVGLVTGILSAGFNVGGMAMSPIISLLNNP